jgi:hypothetical protein
MSPGNERPRRGAAFNSNGVSARFFRIARREMDRFRFIRDNIIVGKSRAAKLLAIITPELRQQESGACLAGDQEEAKTAVMSAEKTLRSSQAAGSCLMAETRIRGRAAADLTFFATRGIREVRASRKPMKLKGRPVKLRTRPQFCRVIQCAVLVPRKPRLNLLIDKHCANDLRSVPPFGNRLQFRTEKPEQSPERATYRSEIASLRRILGWAVRANLFLV